MNYKATAIIRGACDQHVYGTDLNKVKRNAVKKLTEYEPGFGSMWPDNVLVYEQVRVISGNRATWKQIDVINYSSIPDDQLEWKLRKQAREQKRREEHQERMAKACKCHSPATGQLCTMGKGHAGPHQVGGPNHTVETFITQCPSDKCEYHDNRTNMPFGEVIRFQECIRCGHRKPLHVEQYLLETPIGAVELLAINDEEAIELAMKYLARLRVSLKTTDKNFNTLGLYRYPQEWAEKHTKGMIAVEPFVSALSTKHEYAC